MSTSLNSIKAKRYQIRVLVNGLFRGYLSHKDKSQWCYTQARKHCKDIMFTHGWNYQMAEVQ